MNNRRPSKFMARAKAWPIERKLAPVYAEIYRQLKSRGRVLSQADMLLAAMARTIGATLLTNDRDFEAPPDIPRDNWT